MATIVVVDDDELVGRTMCDFLASRGHAASYRLSSGSLLEWLAAHRPDALVLDQMMPGLTGMDTLRMLRSDPDLCEIPVVMMTSHRSQDEIWAALRAGASEYLTKPTHPSELVARIEGLLAANTQAAGASARLH